MKHESTRVTFRKLAPRELAAYIATDEWEGRAGAYAIQGVGASLVRRIEGDYLNVVGLPGRAPPRKAHHGNNCDAAANRTKP